MDQNKSLYETQSLLLAATILCFDIPLDSVDKTEDGKSVFAFPQTDKLRQIIELFWQKSLKIEPNSFWENTRFLKSRIYGG